MFTRFRFNLIVGAISLFVTPILSLSLLMPGFLVAVIGGGVVAGYLLARKELPAIQREGGKAGAMSGIIVGGLGSIGLFLGGIAAEVVAGRTYTWATSFADPGVQIDPITYALRSLTSPSTVIIYLIFGLVITALAGAAGYAGGYVGASSSTPASPPIERNTDKTRRKGLILGTLVFIVVMVIACPLVYFGVTLPIFESAMEQCDGMASGLPRFDCWSRAQSSHFTTTVILILVIGVVVGGAAFYLTRRHFDKRAEREESETLLKE